MASRLVGNFFSFETDLTSFSEENNFHLWNLSSTFSSLEGSLMQSLQGSNDIISKMGKFVKQNFQSSKLFLPAHLREVPSLARHLPVVLTHGTVVDLFVDT